MASLNEYEIAVHPPRRGRQPVLKWAIAAALVIGVGLGFGASFLLAANAKSSFREELRAEMKTQLARERGELFAQVMKVVDEKRAEDARTTLIALDQLNTAHRRITIRSMRTWRPWLSQPRKACNKPNGKSSPLPNTKQPVNNLPITAQSKLSK